MALIRHTEFARFNTQAFGIGNDILNPAADWKVYTNDSAYYWGNNLQVAESFRANEDNTTGYGRNQLVYVAAVGDFIIYTANQRANSDLGW